MKEKKAKGIIFIGFRHKRGSIEYAKEQGYKVILLTEKPTATTQELFDEVVICKLMEAEAIREIIPILNEKYSIKGIISNYEHYVVPRSFLAERFNLPSTSLYGAACTRNKAMQRHALGFMEENIEHRVIQTKAELQQAFKELGGDVYLKSIAGIKSRLVFHVDNQKKIDKAFNQMKSQSLELDEDLYNDYKYCNFSFRYPDPQTTFLVEKAEHGHQISVESFASNHTIWHTPSICDIYTAKHLDRDDSFLAFRILPSKLPQDIIKKAQQTTETTAKILGLRYCPLFTDLIVTPDGKIKLIEIASRMGGYRALMYKHAYNINLYQLMIKSVLGKKINVEKKPKKYISMIEIFAEKEGKFESIQNLEHLDKDKSVHYFTDIMIQKGDVVGPAKLNYPPCIRFMIHGKTYEEVYERSMMYQKQLKVAVL